MTTESYWILGIILEFCLGIYTVFKIANIDFEHSHWTTRLVLTITGLLGLPVIILLWLLDLVVRLDRILIWPKAVDRIIKLVDKNKEVWFTHSKDDIIKVWVDKDLIVKDKLFNDPYYNGPDIKKLLKWKLRRQFDKIKIGKKLPVKNERILAALRGLFDMPIEQRYKEIIHRGNLMNDWDWKLFSDKVFLKEGEAACNSQNG